MSLAVFGPMPETRRNGASSSADTASAICGTVSVERTPSADFGPTPVTPSSWANTGSSSRDSKPNSDRASSRTMSDVWRVTASPRWVAARHLGRHRDGEADSSDLDDDRIRVDVHGGAAD